MSLFMWDPDKVSTAGGHHQPGAQDQPCLRQDLRQQCCSILVSILHMQTMHSIQLKCLPLPAYECFVEQSFAMLPTRGPLFSPRLLTCHLSLLRGYQFKAGFLDGIKREVITIYEIMRDSANNLLYAVPDYQFR